MRPLEDPYELLGLPKGVTQADVRKAHRELARRYHPDANPQDLEAEERFKQIQQAYAVLSDPENGGNTTEVPTQTPGEGLALTPAEALADLARVLPANPREVLPSP